MSDTPEAIEPPLSVTHEAAAVARIRTWNRVYKIAAIWLIGWLGLILEQVVKLDSVINGLQAGLKGRVFVAPFILIITLPLAWLGSRIGSWEKWRRHRLGFTFALPTLFVLMGVVGALKGRYFPQEEFRLFTGADYPRDAQLKRRVYDGGVGELFKLPCCSYEFTCSAAETDRLIREMGLEKEVSPSSSAAPSGAAISSGAVVPSAVVASAGPSSKGWIMTEVWRGKGSSAKVNIELQTDAAHSKLWISCK